MKYLSLIAVALSLFSIWYSYTAQKQNYELALGSSVLSTASSDTLETFRTNVNSSLSSLQNDRVSTTSAWTWTALQTFVAASSTLSSAAFAEIGGTATTTFTRTGRVGIASSSPFTALGLGTVSATTTISGGKFCAYFTDEAGRGMWVKLSISGNTVFSTSTSSCN